MQCTVQFISAVGLIIIRALLRAALWNLLVVKQAVKTCCDCSGGRQHANLAKVDAQFVKLELLR